MRFYWFALFLFVGGVYAAEQSSGAQSSESRFKRLEDQHEKEMIKAMEDRQAIREDLRKNNSPECRFWKLQQKEKPTPKAAMKIKEFCSQGVAQKH